jgi:anaerobic magnesium-protoporphyrin IX monomethyl ester cyclase
MTSTAGRRLVLINPSFQARIRRIAQTSVGPPLGLAYLAAAARRAGHDPRVVDANALQLTPAQAAEAALAQSPEAIGLTATTPTLPLAAAIARALKARRPELPILVGGPHVSALPARSLAEHPAFDLVIRGEGERLLPDLLARLPARADASMEGLSDLQGLAWHGGDGEVVDTGIAEPIQDLDSLAPPARDLLPMARYRCPDSDAFTTLLAMRGCPYPCVYCNVPRQFGRRMRYRDPELVADEMAAVHRDFGVRFVSFVDDTFTTDRAWVDAFMAALHRRGLPRILRWICLTRADLVDRPLLHEMRRAGCVRVEFGIESGSAAGRAFLDKRLAPGAIERAFDDAHAVGLSTMGFIILNIPGETAQDIAATFALARRADPDYLQVSFLTPYPGTPLWDHAQREGWVRTEDWSQYSFLNDAVLEHGTLAPGELERLHGRFIRGFYLRPITLLKLGRLVLKGTTEPLPLARTMLLGLLGALRRPSKGRSSC